MTKLINRLLPNQPNIHSPSDFYHRLKVAFMLHAALNFVLCKKAY